MILLVVTYNMYSRVCDTNFDLISYPRVIIITWVGNSGSILLLAILESNKKIDKNHRQLKNELLRLENPIRNKSLDHSLVLFSGRIKGTRESSSHIVNSQCTCRTTFSLLSGRKTLV